MALKRYYWLKLPEDFFRDKTMKKLRKIAGGDTYVVIYLKMMLRGLKSDGYLYFEGLEKDFAAELALDLDEDEDNVRVTIDFLLRTGKLEMKSEQEYAMLDMEQAIGSETAAAERKRAERARKKQPLPNNEPESLPCDNVTGVSQLRHVEIEKEIEKDNLSFFLERCEDFSTSQQSFNKPMLKDVQRYAEAENIQTDVQRFYSYYERTGWKTKNGRPITDWKSTLRYWANTDKKDADTSKKNPNDSHVDAKKSAAYAGLIYNLDEYNPPDK